jgi:hypothetical protein
MKIRQMAVVALTGAMALLGACKSQDGTPKAGAAVNGKSTDSTYQISVREKLHTQHLLSIPEVKSKSDFFVEKYRSGAETREAAAQEFSAWLDDFASKNPDKVKAAQGGAPAVQAAPAAAPAKP